MKWSRNLLNLKIFWNVGLNIFKKCFFNHCFYKCYWADTYPEEICTICWIKNSSGNQGVGPAFRTGTYSRNWLVWKIRGLGVTFSRGALYSLLGMWHFSHTNISISNLKIFFSCLYLLLCDLEIFSLWYLTRLMWFQKTSTLIKQRI